MRNLLWTFSIVSAFGLLGTWYWWEAHGVNKLKTKIEKMASQHLEGQVKIKVLTAPADWPFKVQVFNTQINSDKKGIEGTIDRITATLSFKSFSLKKKKFFPDIDLKIKKAQLKIKKLTQPVAVTAAPTQAFTGPQNFSDLRLQFPSLQDLSFHLNISDSQIEMNQFTEEPLILHNWTTNLGLENLNSPLRFAQSFNTLLKIGQVSVSAPVLIEGQTELKNGQIDLLGFRARILNIESLLSGYFNLNAKSFLVQGKTAVPDLSKVPIDVPEFPLSSWKGSLSFEYRVSQENPNQPLSATGSFSLKDFQAKIKYLVEKEAIDIEGPLKISSQGQFQFLNRVPSLLYFPNLQWKVDFTDTKIKYKDVFYKHPSVELTSEGDIAWNQLTQIKQASLKFYSLTANAVGTIDLKQNSNLALDFQTPSLKGFESFLPALSSSPLSGSLMGQMQFSGPLGDPKNLRIDVKKLELRQGQGKVSLKNETLNIDGPFLVDVKASGIVNKMQVEQGQVSFQSQLSGMLIQSKDLQKMAGDPLSLDIQAQKNNNKLEIKNGMLTLAAGKIQFSGVPPLAPSETFDLKLHAMNLNLQKLSETLPVIKNFLKAGNYEAQLSLKGQLNLKNIFQSPLLVSGTQELNIPTFTYSSLKSQPAQTVPASGLQTPKAFLDDGLLIQGIHVNTKLQIQELNFNNLKISGIQTQALVKNKTLSLTGNIQSVFDGSVKINSLNLPLTTANPFLGYNLSVKNLNTEPALLWLSEKAKDLLKGRMNLDIQGQSFLPSSPQFLSAFVAQGKFQMNEGVLNTLPFEKMAKDALGKIPGVGQIKNSPGPLNANLSSNFSFAKTKLEIKDFLAVTPRKEEMRLNGNVGLDLTAELAGQVALVDASVSGSFFQANSDAQKRLLVPIKIDGNLMKPQMSFAQETVKIMLQKTVDFEKQKLSKTAQQEINKAKKQAEDQLKKEADKNSNELKEKASQGLQKGLENLLGR